MGAAIVATRAVIDQTTPAALAMLRYLAGFACLAPALLLAPRARFERRDVAPVAALGITQFGILIALLNFGLQSLSASRAALIFATFPMLTMIFAAATGRERLTVAKTLGVVLSVVGVGIALGESAWRVDAQAGQWTGVLAVLASAACGAVCSVLYRPYLEKYPTLPVSAFAMLASVGFLAVLAYAEGFFTTPLAIDSLGWSIIAFLGLCSGLGYFLWLWALRHSTPTRVTVFLALSPVTAAMLGVLLLGEQVSPGLLLGIALVGGGLWLAHRERPEPGS